MSLLYWHNCWLDTFTAFLNMVHAGILFCYLAYTNGQFLTSEDKMVFFWFFATAVIHSPPSMAYHLIGCSGRSYEDYIFYQKLDFVFIFVSSIPLAFSLCYFTFATNTWLLVSVCGVVLCTIFTYFTVRGGGMEPMQRLRLISALVLCYVLPVLYQVGIDMAAGHWHSASMWWGLGIMASLTMGAYAYGTKFPERVWPDFPISSHSLMHLGVNLAYLSEFFFILNQWRAFTLARLSSV